MEVMEPFGRGDPLFQLPQFSREGGLIAHRRRHTPEQGGNFRACLHVAENVVDKEEYVLILRVAEIFRHGQSREGGAHSRAGGFVHLPEHQGGVLKHARLRHFLRHLKPFAAALSDADEHRTAVVVGGDA